MGKELESQAQSPGIARLAERFELRLASQGPDFELHWIYPLPRPECSNVLPTHQSEFAHRASQPVCFESDIRSIEIFGAQSHAAPMTDAFRFPQMARRLR